MPKRKYRIGQIPARDVASGDILIEMAYDQGGIRWDLAQPIGTVLTVQNHGGTVSWVVRTVSDAVRRVTIECKNPAELTYVHVPWGQL